VALTVLQAGDTDQNFSSQDRVEFSVTADGAGGSLTVDHAFLLAQFGTPVKPTDLLVFFAREFPTAALCAAAMRALEVTIIPRATLTGAVTLTVDPTDDVNSPAYIVSGAAGAGAWRVRIRMPHSVMG
jgi:hypothetical protein